jgi:hypothetical protein
LNKLLIALLLPVTQLLSQQTDLSLKHANTIAFNGSFYAGGILHGSNSNAVRVYKMNPALKITDSATIQLSKKFNGEFLKIGMDTLHGQLSMYLQQKDVNTVGIIRLKNDLTVITSSATADAGRINNRHMLGNAPWYQGKYVYSIRYTEDSSGRQFYLDKFVLSDSLSNYDYKLQWQYPFERKHIYAVRIMELTPSSIFLFAIVNEGSRQGQWLLRLRTKNGELAKAVRLSKKDEAAILMPGCIINDTVNKYMLLCGQKLNPKDADLSRNTLAIQPAGFHELYLIEIDSLNEPIFRKDYRLPVTEPKTVGSKPGGYLLRLSLVNKNRPEFYCDLMKNQQTGYRYVNTVPIVFKREPEGWEMEKIQLFPNTDIESWFYTTDKKDLNGKLFADSAGGIENMYYKNMSYPGKLAFGFESEGSPYYILSRSETKKSKITYALLNSPDKKTIVRTLEEPERTASPVFCRTGPVCILAWQLTDNIYRIKIIH